MRNRSEDEDCRRAEPDETEAGRARHRRELIEKALAQFPQPEPQPSEEEVESVFRSVMSTY
jgi:CRISPR/Cas system-associated protein Csm6